MSDDEHNLAKELVCKIHQFLQHQIQTNTELTEDTKESLTVASECIEQSYQIERKQPSNELLEIYKAHKNGPQIPGFTNLGAGGPQIRDAMSLFQNLASSFMNPQAGTTTNDTPTSPEQPNSSTTAQQTTADAEVAPSSASNDAPNESIKRKERPPVTEAEKIAADSFKNQGNDHMRVGNYKEAYDSYTQAIEIDPNNAIYYSNRAAALSKLGDHEAAIKDSKEAIEIDPKYGKAYGRLGVAFSRLGDHIKSRDAYKKAVELDPDNEAHRDNLATEEEMCKQFPSHTTEGAQGTQPNMMSGIMSMLNNPSMIQMAMRTASDPRIQNVLGNFVTQLTQQQPQQPPQQPPTTDQQQQQPPPGTS